MAVCPIISLTIPLVAFKKLKPEGGFAERPQSPEIPEASLEKMQRDRLARLPITACNTPLKTPERASSTVSTGPPYL